MRPAHEIEKLKKIPLGPVFSAKDAKKVGLSPALLSYYAKGGRLQKVSRGVYLHPHYKPKLDLNREELVLTAKSIPNGVICMISALDLYRLTDEIPRQHWIAIPNSQMAPRRPHTKIVRTRDMRLGKTTIRIGSEVVPIFNRERTIVDAFRLLSIETALKALKAGVKAGGSEKLDLPKLQEYARRLRKPIEPYLTSITA